MVNLLLAFAVSGAAMTTIYVSWRHSYQWTRLTGVAGWLLIGLSAVWWIRVGGAEFGVAYAAMAAAFGAWGVVVALGREARRPEERRPQPRVARESPGRASTLHTLARTFVALPLAGTASLLAAVAGASGMPWGTVNRYVFAIFVAPIIWGVFAMWVGMTERLQRAALVLAGVSGACAALLFLR
jgi:hypothetical protein